MKTSEDLQLVIFGIVEEGRKDGLASEVITGYIVKAIEEENEDIDINVHLTPNSKHYDKFIELLNKCRH
jgi:hypothetical protein